MNRGPVFGGDEGLLLEWLDTVTPVSGRLRFWTERLLWVESGLCVCNHPTMRAQVIAISAGVIVATIAAGVLLTKPKSWTVAPQPAAPSSTAAAFQGERIALPTLGLSVVRPRTWSTITADENVRNLAAVHMDDRHLQELAVQYAATPIIAFAKYREPYGDLNPSFKINIRPLGSFAGHAPEEVLNAAIPTLRRMFGDLNIDYAPTRTTLSGKAAAYTRLSYTLRTGGHEFPTVSEIWLVPNGPVFFMIGTGTRADEKNGSRREARAIVDSIQIR